MAASRLLDPMSSSSTLSSAFTASSLNTCPSLSSSSNASSVEPEQSSVTPARKHRKMLKDGTSEVWPEYLERIFVQGLHAYWSSPWATYTKGRSRWRNQFLVDYLHNAGIDRSKKQVASHIQVLRNMWKGQKEYELVASADELVNAAPAARSSPGSPRPHKSRVRQRPRARSTLSDDPEPESPIDVKEEPAEEEVDHGLLAVPEAVPFSPRTDKNEDGPAKHELTSSPELSGPLSPFSADSPASSPAASTFTAPDCHFPPHHDARGRALSTAPIGPVQHACHLAALSLWAEGMHPVSFDLASLISGATAPGTRAVLRVQLRASLLSDVTSPPTMHGFQGTVSFSGRWLRAATCITRVIVDGVCDSEEAGAFDPAASLPSTSGTTAFLPDSWLSRCRWRNAGLPTRLVQQIAVDGTEIATILYDLERPESGCAAAVLLGCSLEGPRPRAISTERTPPAYTWEPRARPTLHPRAQTLSFPPSGQYLFPSTLFS
ncbi:hypothetical protein K488DRAFT_71951 [Vararia minispora EC-137]|uniref:Uncharacterized protein n=1 Tax=Vararia minispora EC-137 TaxID=1314806 RepID=A0ACB8QGS9_9AGAM|nr:hypothetical protein K488DRAFT_71951 [Vararia minispora EC-137]